MWKNKKQKPKTHDYSIKRVSESKEPNSNTLHCPRKHLKNPNHPQTSYLTLNKFTLGIVKAAPFPVLQIFNKYISKQISPVKVV